MPTRVFWTTKAKQDLRAIKAFIARGAPVVAKSYVHRLRMSAERLKTYPFSGQVVTEIGREDIREILFDSYRLIYRIGKGRVDILTVYHAARMLRDDDLYE